MKRSKYVRPKRVAEQGEGSEEGKPRLTTSAMIASIAGEGQRTKAAPFGHALAALAAERPEIVGMTADLGKYTDLHIFAKAHPDRYYQMGMAEQLLLAAAAGMAHEGFIPFATTYAVFATRRAYDFMHQAICNSVAHGVVYVAGSEDLALMRAMPGMTVIDPCDALEIEQAVPQIAAHPGPVYMRLLRGQVPLMLDEYNYQFELGKAKLLRDGSDVLLISTGLMTMRALEAVDWLKSNKIDAAVLHVSTIKPLDEQTILKEAAKSGRMVVVAENHSIIGGLGEAVAGLLLRSGVTPVFRQVALPDEYLDAGALPTLHERYGISAEAMARTITTWLSGRLVPKRAVA